MNDSGQATDNNVPDNGVNENRHASDNKIENGIRDFTDRIGELFRQGNRRRFELHDAEGKAIFSLPLTIAVLIGLFLLWRLPVLLIIAAVAALFLKAKFVLTREHGTEIVEPNDE